MGFEPVQETNLVPIGIYEFLPNPCVSLQTKGNGSPTRSLDLAVASRSDS